jgi:hypothetical protein
VGLRQRVLTRAKTGPLASGEHAVNVLAVEARA